MAYRLKVIAGAHVQDGRRYEKGKAFDSDRDLSKIFAGKFVLLRETQAAASTPAPEPAEPENKAEEEEEEEFKLASPAAKTAPARKRRIRE